jgi:diguanylate cyclase (GGDEF)-like protein
MIAGGSRSVVSQDIVVSESQLSRGALDAASETPVPEWLALRRRMGIATCLLGASAAIAVSVLEWQKGQPDLFEVYGLPAIAVWTLALALIYRGRHAVFAEAGLVFAGAGILLGLLFVALIQPRASYESIIDAYEILAWFPALYLFSFALFSKAKALVFSVAVLAVSLLFSHLGPVAVPPEARLGFLEVYIANLGCIGFIFTLSALKERYVETQDLAEALRHSADTDYLTGIHNRRWMERRLDAELARCAALGQPIALVMLDVDRFKAVNDEFGHDARDRVLQRVARVLDLSVRARDLLARWGGEEFLIGLPGIALEAAVDVSERIRRMLEAQHGGSGPAATASFGVTAAVVGDDVEGLIRRADEALRLAKREGRNRVVTQAA